MSPSKTSAHDIDIEPLERRVVVELGGEKLADSDDVLVLREGSLPERYYFPKRDVRMDLFRPTDTSTTCPFKGQASYWAAVIDGTGHDDVMWAYEDPIPEASDIAGRVCFYNDKVDLKLA